MKKEEQEKAILLRKEGKALSKIAQELGVAKSSVSLWVRHVVLSEEQKERLSLFNPGQKKAAEAIMKKCEKIRLSFQEDGRRMAKTPDSKFAMGCMLFWAEGAKNRNKLSFCNTDAEMMKFFIGFLRTYFGVKNEDITMSVLCHLDNGFNIEEIQKYWLNLLALDSTCLRKSTIVTLQGGKKGKHPYGVCTIRVHSVELVQKIWGAIQELVGFTKEEISNKRYDNVYGVYSVRGGA